MNDLKVLIVEDSEKDAALLLRKLKEAGYNPLYERVDNRAMMKSALERQKWDIILSDYVMPQFSGLSALELLHQSGIDIPFIVVSGQIGEDVAVEAMRAGASDYLMKANMKRLGAAIARELVEAENRRQRRRAEQELAMSEVELRKLSHRLIEMQEDERQSLSRELHDEIGHTLAYLRLMVDRAGQLSAHDAQTILNEAKDIISRLIEQIRSLSLSLKPPMLEEDGLVQAVKYLAERQAKESGMTLSLSSAELPADLSWDVSLAAYRIIQEALTNIIKHAAAHKITIEIKVENGQLEITVTDDGKGFVVAKPGSGSGLRGMRERALILNGTIAVESKPGIGTIVRASIPLVHVKDYSFL